MTRLIGAGVAQSTGPLAEARAKWRTRERLKTANARSTEVVKILTPDLVIGLLAAGIPTRQAAIATGTDPRTIESLIQRTPDARARIVELRQTLKLTKIEAANRLEGRMWERLGAEVETGTAKDVDAMARALLASEKIQAGVAGEGLASGAPPAGGPGVIADVQMLIQVLLERSGGPGARA